MSFNQSRSDKSEAQFRKTGRSASSNQQQRTSSGAYGKGGGGVPAPSPSPSSSASLSSNRSFKKSNNAQGGQSRANSSESTNAYAARNVQNGGHVRPQLQGGGPAVPKPIESPSSQRSARPVPKGPTPQSTTATSENATPAVPAKGDTSKAFPFQFGTITMEGMQIPARTSSAPPNLDEQKRDQARHDSAFRAVPNLPIPVPKQQLPRKDSGATDQSNAGEAHPVPKVKKDVQTPPATANPTQKPSVLAMPISSMQMPPYHQTQVSMPFGAPNPPMQPPATSLQMPMHITLPMGNAPPVQQQVYVQSLQHPLPPQGMIHQGQGLGFTPPMGGQLPPPLGNLGMGITQQYPQQQGGKFGAPRKTTPVKITHPETHEELRLDKRTDMYSDAGSSGLRSHPNLPSQSQPISSFPINYYPNSVFYPTSSSLPMSSNQMTPNAQGSRFNYPVSQGPQNIPFMNSAAGHNSFPVNKPINPMHGVLEPRNLEHARDAHNITSIPPGTTQVTVKPATGTVGEKIGDSSSPSNSPAAEKLASPKPSGESNSAHSRKDLEASSESSIQQPKSGSDSLTSKSLPLVMKQSVMIPAAVSDESLKSSLLPSTSPTTSEESMPVMVNHEVRRKEQPLNRSNSMKEHQKKPSKKGHNQPQNQVSGQSTSTPHLALSISSEHTTSSGGAVSETIDGKAAVTSLTAGELLSKSARESFSTVDAPTSVASESKHYSNSEGITSCPSEVSTAGLVDMSDTARLSEVDDYSVQDQKLKTESCGTKEGKNKLPERPIQDNARQNPSQHITLRSLELINETSQESSLKETIYGNEIPSSGAAQDGPDESVSSCMENERAAGDISVSTSRISSSASDDVVGHADSDISSSSGGNNGVTITKSSLSDQQLVAIPITDISETNSKNEGEAYSPSGLKDKPTVELSRMKSITKLRRKRKEMLKNADAQGTSSDLYMAYKGPEEKKELVAAAESAESNCAVLKQASPDVVDVEGVENEKVGLNKTEPDDWEDAADISTPKLEASDNGELSGGSLVNPDDKDGNGNLAKKYSRDFLLKFADQCVDLPEGFEITSDIADFLMSTNVNTSHHVDRDSYPSPGRVLDRQSSGSRMDRRGVVDDDRWSKVSGAFGLGRELRLDVPYGSNAGFRPGQGGNYGVLKPPRVQTPIGILTMQPIGSQGMMQRNSTDADRWHRAANYQQKGLIPSPQTPLQMMHKAEKKYEVGKVTDEEEAKQRQLKGILNKLTPQNFDKLFEQVKAVNIDNASTLTGVISQIFDKALTEPTFCEMYANFCHHLAGALPDFSEDNEKITFKRLLLNKCQEEFERGEREQEEANKVEEGEAKQSEEEREEKRIKARRRMLGNIRLIGELYKKKMLTERIMHECITKLLGQSQNPDEEDVEALCKLMSTIGEIIDHPKAKVHMDAYFDLMTKLSNNMKLSSRVRFMLKDAIDLRKNKWQQRRKVEGPKKIEEVHRDAAQERQAQGGRLGRGSGINSAARRVPMDFGPRGSAMLSSPGAQMGSFRGLPSQARGFGGQDVRIDDRQSFEARTLSVPLSQRLNTDDSITLGPQGGLARSFRGPSNPISDISASPGDSRRASAGLNGFNSASERTTFGSREDLVPRFTLDRYPGPAAYDQLSSQERNMSYGNRDPRNPDRNFDRPPVASPSARVQAPGLSQNIPQEKVSSEEHLRDMSIAAIKEFYSARDEKEVALCIKDLNSPSFHPSMIALWVSDSFERKDLERDLLAKLLVNLTKPRDGTLNQGQLIAGFESVLSTLEDAVNDAPKAAEFLGLILAKVIMGDVLSLGEIDQLLRNGEAAGRLLEVGLAGEVLVSTVAMIKKEKGETVLKESLKSSNLRLESFRPPDPDRSRKLELLIREVGMH
ncbi:hypothetical protein SLEP1_g23815 [Rubroshorea leprosula]|uniref:Eukaryotic translation initiation factor 4G n=1 Tax=Rubroshorea leprosula TaxID=152421 RepID=A0AAV5JN36_9ROSI|nr:hypothetical protein SLEP1_g23815 [Rubroshorea leprosula]